jgi:lipoyl(octanoyl) transferase
MERQFIYRELKYIDLGLADYRETWDRQKALMEKRKRDEIPDTFLLCEHPHTYTLGKIADKGNLISSEEYLREKSISVFEIDRGGDITYHGPGQVVGYPIIDLAKWRKDTHLYLRTLEQTIIDVCAYYGLDASRNDKYTGVWIEDRKICAIGIKISRWITMHGFAFNVNTDLSLYNGIIPCGINDKEVTSLQKELNRTIDLNEVKQSILESFRKNFGYVSTPSAVGVD